MELNDVQLSRINKIIVNNEDVINVNISNNGETLLISSNINPKVIDSNFDELDKRLSDLESTVKLRILGQLNKISNEQNS